MKKILVFGITDNPGGVESVIMSYYRHIDRNKIQFDFLCNTEIVAHEEEILSLGGKIYRVCARSKDRNKYKKDMDSFYSVHSKEYDAIWMNVCSLANIDYLKYAKKYGIPRRIIHSHNSQNMDTKLRGLLHKINKKNIDKYATDFWACSRDAAYWFYKDEIAKNAVIIHNAIDWKKMGFNQEKREQIRKEYNLENAFVIGNVGRLHFQKNQEFIIDIFNELHKEDDKFKLVLVGQGEDEKKLKEKVEQLNLNDYVCFTGVQSDIQAWLSAFDFFLFPSQFEGLSIAGLEAQANGVPMLCSAKVNPLELKVNSNFEFMSLEKDKSEWASKIKNLAKEGRISSSEIASNFINAGYDIETESLKLEQLMDSIFWINGLE